MFSEKPWNLFREKTERATGPDADDVIFAANTGLSGRYSILEDEGRKVVVVSLGEEYSTNAGRRAPLSLVRRFYKGWQKSSYSVLLENFKEKLRIIAEREDNWDGKMSKKPSILAVSKAHIMLDDFLSSVVNSGRLWKTPFVSSGEDGHITIQWNSGDHELHIEVSEEGAEYIKVWGSNIEHEMHLGVLEQTKFLHLWDWLSGECGFVAVQQQTEFSKG